MDIYRDCPCIKMDIYRDSPCIKMDIYQDSPGIKMDIYQDCPGIKMDIYRDSPGIKMDIYLDSPGIEMDIYWDRPSIKTDIQGQSQYEDGFILGQTDPPRYKIWYIQSWYKNGYIPEKSLYRNGCISTSFKLVSTKQTKLISLRPPLSKSIHPVSYRQTWYHYDLPLVSPYHTDWLSSNRTSLEKVHISHIRETDLIPLEPSLNEPISYR